MLVIRKASASVTRKNVAQHVDQLVSKLAAQHIRLTLPQVHVPLGLFDVARIYKMGTH
jgi:hypothetical protein